MAVINRNGIARLSLHGLTEQFDLEEIDSFERCPTIFQLSASGLLISLSNGGKSDFRRALVSTPAEMIASSQMAAMADSS
ncbi:hypothetical protein TIFTF001_024651 [Ficus carica]|uniref:Uncharacterized protein n=1 Tax=Ficus carica TaxID=3494 RepID=A0AA88AMU5_FICCA|nr:hypothetical protein TIFTF001_024651 [Ficus carica]